MRNLVQHRRLSFFSELQYGQYISDALFHWCSYNSFEIFKTILEKNLRISSRSQVFCKIGVLKKLTNFTRKHQCCSPFLIMSLETKRLQHRHFTVNFTKPLRTPLLQNTSGTVGVCLQKSFTL